MKRSNLAFAFLLFSTLASHPIHAAQRRTPIVDVVEKSRPAVVSVIALAEVSQRVNPFYGRRPMNMFDFFFGRPNGGQIRKSLQEVGLGSGVVIDPDGYVLTNHHVIANAKFFRIEYSGGEQIEAELVGADDDLDIAVLKMKSDQPMPYIRPGRSNDLMIGETVIAIGSPFGLSHTVTTGVISAIGRKVEADNRVYSDFIQTDASINPGNSGGPLLNINGELIGINTAIRQNAEGIGFAIPIEPARRIYENLIRFGKVNLAWVGLSLQPLTDDLKQALGYTRQPGVLVNEVDEDSPAQKAGIRREDLLTHIGAKKIGEVIDYYDALRTYTVGDKIQLKVIRDQKEKSFALRGAKLGEDRAMKIALGMLGLRLEPNGAGLAREYGLTTEEGLVITGLYKGSEAHRIGLQPGDIVRQLGGRDINTAAELAEMVLRLRTNTKALLMVQRGQYGYYVTLPIRTE